jgi:hypothetical protein
MILVERERRRVRMSFMPIALLEWVRTSDPGRVISAGTSFRTDKRGSGVEAWRNSSEMVKFGRRPGGMGQKPKGGI